MKSILILVALVGISFAGFAQGNLQFSRVVLWETDFMLATNALNQFVEQTITVPAGKVWKIEGAYATYRNNSPTNPTYHTWPQLLINNKLIHSSSSSSSTTTAWYNYLPMWLPEGTYTVRVVSYNGSSQGNEVFAGLSAIEFNLTP